jgi:hypothetical protein
MVEMAKRPVRLPRSAVIALGVLVTLGAFVLVGAPDEVWNSALWDEADSLASAFVTPCVTAPGLQPIGFVPELVVIAAPAPPVGRDAPRAPPAA